MKASIEQIPSSKSKNVNGKRLSNTPLKRSSTKMSSPDRGKPRLGDAGPASSTSMVKINERGVVKINGWRRRGCTYGTG